MEGIIRFGNSTGAFGFGFGATEFDDIIGLGKTGIRSVNVDGFTNVHCRLVCKHF